MCTGMDTLIPQSNLRNRQGSPRGILRQVTPRMKDMTHRFGYAYRGTSAYPLVSTCSTQWAWKLGAKLLVSAIVNIHKWPVTYMACTFGEKWGPKCNGCTAATSVSVHRACGAPVNSIVYDKFTAWSFALNLRIKATRSQARYLTGQAEPNVVATSVEAACFSPCIMTLLALVMRGRAIICGAVPSM
jgi:hypothetical protein